MSIRRKGHPPIYECFDNLRDAQAFVAKTESNLSEGAHYGYARIRTLADSISEFESKASSIKTHRDRKRALAWWRQRDGGVRLKDFDAPMVLEAERALSTEPCQRYPTSPAKTRAPRTVRFYSRVPYQAMRFGVDMLRWIPTNPVAAVKLPPPSPGRVRWLSDDERKALLEACKRSQNPDLYNRSDAAATTGRRRFIVVSVSSRTLQVASPVPRGSGSRVGNDHAEGGAHHHSRRPCEAKFETTATPARARPAVRSTSSERYRGDHLSLVEDNQKFIDRGRSQIANGEFRLLRGFHG